MDTVKRRTTIGILLGTKDSLDEIKHEGQSYNGVIQELVRFWRDNKGEYWTRRKEQRAREEESARAR